MIVCSKGKIHHGLIFASIGHFKTKCNLQNTTSPSGIGYISVNLDSIDIGTPFIIRSAESA